MKKLLMQEGVEFCNKFYHIDRFPQGFTNVTALAVLGNVGHPTTEERLLLVDGHYYIGQPVCRGCGWYKVPAIEWEQFKVCFIKAYKFSL